MESDPRKVVRGSLPAVKREKFDLYVTKNAPYAMLEKKSSQILIKHGKLRIFAAGAAIYKASKLAVQLANQSEQRFSLKIDSESQTTTDYIVQDPAMSNIERKERTINTIVISLQPAQN